MIKTIDMLVGHLPYNPTDESLYRFIDQTIYAHCGLVFLSNPADVFVTITDRSEYHANT